MHRENVILLTLVFFSSLFLIQYLCHPSQGPNFSCFWGVWFVSCIIIVVDFVFQSIGPAPLFVTWVSNIFFLYGNYSLFELTSV
jgi:hypothetical protein